MQENDIADAPGVILSASTSDQRRAERTGMRITDADRDVHRGFRRHVGDEPIWNDFPEASGV